MDERNLPIDIHLKKLLDWLISRRICNRQWYDNIRKVREKISDAIVDMPEHPKIKELLSGANINYWHCTEIIEILKDTEKDTRNFFGQYGSQRMTLWKEVVSLYEKENIYLAEAAQLLSQAISYDLPGLKKQISKLSQVQVDCDKKAKDNERKAAEFRQDFHKSCAQLGIEGKHLRKEIIALVDDLPRIYDQMTEECKKLKLAVEAYENFVGIPDLELLPTLKFLIARGNVTTYEWIHGEAPLSIEEQKIAFEFPDEEEAKPDNIEIDFNLDLSAPVDLSSIELEAPVDIDWGDLDGGENENVTIDWDAVDVVAEVQIESTGVEGGVARDSDALSLLDNRKTRNLLLDDLHELQCFLQQRYAESSDMSFSSVLLSPSLSKEVKSEELAQFSCDVKNLISQLTTGKLHHLQLVKTSPSYVHRLIENTMQKSRLADKLDSGNVALAEKVAEAVTEQSQTVTKLNLMTIKARELQDHIEKDISKRYQNRKVNIIGGAQTI